MVTVGVLINGTMRAFRADGVSESLLNVPLFEGHAESLLTIPSSSLDAGLNRVDILNYIHRNGGYRLVAGPTFTVANGSLAEPVFEFADDLEAGSFVASQPTQAFRTFSTHPEWGERLFTLWTGHGDILEVPTPTILRIQPGAPRTRQCAAVDENADEVMVLAFRDMRPLPLGEAERVVVSGLRAGEQRVYRFDLDTTFPDDEFHHLVIVAFSGLTRPTRVGDGGYAPWASSRIVTELFWGWEPTEP
ncbi:MAG: hypothetical protein J0L92_16770 [Deltaproteobacteria bacterium]|nr:hypothetical protein [Deltaproteobacteria bacterium]